jgi:hypothetical protein
MMADSSQDTRVRVCPEANAVAADETFELKWISPTSFHMMYQSTSVRACLLCGGVVPSANVADLRLIVMCCDVCCRPLVLQSGRKQRPTE